MSLWLTASVMVGAILCLYGLKIYLDSREIDADDPFQRAHLLDENAHARAESLLRASVTPQEYAFLLENDYLEVPSRLYANRIYQIPRKRRRVRVYAMDRHDTTKRYKLGELCLIACEPVPDADVVLTHKWLLEADEQTYLATANWISGHWNNGLPV